MSSPRLIERVGAVELVGLAVLRDYRHRFNKHGSDNTAKGNIEPAPGARVLGVLYRLRSTQLETLRSYEGGYRESTVEVEVGPNKAAATVFVAELLHTDLKPTLEYLSHYRAAAAEHAIPEDYLQEIMGPWAGASM